MIVCSCNGISCRDIADTVNDLLIEAPLSVITPGGVYRAMKKRPKCGGCLPHAAELIHKHAACLRGCHGHTDKQAHQATPALRHHARSRRTRTEIQTSADGAST